MRSAQNFTNSFLENSFKKKKKKEKRMTLFIFQRKVSVWIVFGFSLELSSRGYDWQALNLEYTWQFLTVHCMATYFSGQLVFMRHPLPNPVLYPPKKSLMSGEDKCSLAFFTAGQLLWRQLFGDYCRADDSLSGQVLGELTNCQTLALSRDGFSCLTKRK